MKEIDLEKYRSAWKNNESFEKQKLSDQEINKFLHANSKSIIKLFKKGITFDIVMKLLLVTSFGVHIFLFKNDPIVLSMAILLTIITMSSTLYQMEILKRIPSHQFSENIRELLIKNIDFYNKRYIRSLLVASLSNSMFFISGSMFYFFFKYGKIRPFQLDDYLVFGGAIVLSFILGAFIHIKQHNFHINQLESCLQEIDDETINEHSLKQRKNQQKRNILIMVILLVFGLLLFSYIFFQ